MSWNERTSDGTPSFAIALPDRLKKLLLARQQDPSAPVVIPPGASAPASLSGDEPAIAPRSPVPSEPDYAPGQVIQAPPQEPAFTRPRTVGLPMLPERGVDDAVRNAATKEYGYPADADLPILPYRPSSAVLAPDMTVNPDYAGEGRQSQAGEDTIRPKFADPYGRIVKQIQYEMDNPAKAAPHRGKWHKVGDALEMGAISAGRAIAADPNHSLASAVGGFGAGTILQGVRPDTLARTKQDFRVGRYENQLGEMNAIRGAQIKQEGELADADYKRAQAHRILNPLPQTEVVKVKGQGAYLVNKQTGERRKIDLPPEVNPDEWEQTEANGLLFWRNKRTQETKPMTNGGRQLQNDADRPVSLTPTPGGPTLSVRQGQAASAIIQAGGTQAGEENAQRRVDYENELGRQREASDAVAAHTAAKTALDKSQAQGKALEKTRADVDKRIQQIAFDPKRGADPDDLNKDAEYQGLIRRKEQLDAQYEQVLQENGRLYDAYRSAETALQGRHAQYVRRRDDGSYEAVTQPVRPNVVRRGQPRVGQVAAPPISENDFVSAARSKMGAQFNEAKARAAWQKKYGR